MYSFFHILPVYLSYLQALASNLSSKQQQQQQQQNQQIQQDPLFFQLPKFHLSYQEKVRYSLIKNVEDYQVGIYDKPLPCFGCGKGWFCFLVGFLFPPLWYYATALYFGNYYRKDPRERAGLAASAVAAMACTIVVLIVLLASLL